MSKYQDLIGSWKVDWSRNYSEIEEPRLIGDGKKIEFKLKERKKGFLGFGTARGKSIVFKCEDVAKQVFTRLGNTFELYG